MSDNKETVELCLSDEELLRYMIMAHELDITFNQFVELALKQAIEKHLSEDKHD